MLIGLSLVFDVFFVNFRQPNLPTRQHFGRKLNISIHVDIGLDFK